MNIKKMYFLQAQNIVFVIGFEFFSEHICFELSRNTKNVDTETYYCERPTKNNEKYLCYATIILFQKATYKL